MSDDFNSSDLEFEEPSRKKQADYVKGQASIDDIIENAQSDRIASKHTVKQLEFAHGAPSTQDNQLRWVRLFNTFREHTLKQSLKTLFTGDDMLRFLDSIIGKLKPKDCNKPVPNDDIVHTAIKILLSYGEFTWAEKDGFKISRHDGAHLQTWLDDAIKAGRLIKGL